MTFIHCETLLSASYSLIICPLHKVHEVNVYKEGHVHGSLWKYKQGLIEFVVGGCAPKAAKQMIHVSPIWHPFYLKLKWNLISVLKNSSSYKYIIYNINVIKIHKFY